MKVKVTHIGFNALKNLHSYYILCANGHVDICEERTLIETDEIEVDEAMWSEGSGWVSIECNVCHTTYRERCRPGMVVACPMCGEPELIPEEVILEESNLE